MAKPKADTKRRIADKLVSMLEDHGSLDDITVKELTSRLGISRQAF